MPVHAGASQICRLRLGLEETASTAFLAVSGTRDLSAPRTLNHAIHLGGQRAVAGLRTRAYNSGTRPLTLPACPAGPTATALAPGIDGGDEMVCPPPVERGNQRRLLRCRAKIDQRGD